MPTRLATAQDAADVAILLTEFNDEFGTPSPAIDVLTERFGRLVGRPDTFVLLALGPEPVGFALVTTRPSPYYEGPIASLDELYVAPSLRGQGRGSELMSLLLQEARARDVGEIQINVDEGDAGARRFYAQHGFAHHQDGEQMLCYVREL